jgi:hypothetical protein
MGALGSRKHHRCRYCGWQWSVKGRVRTAKAVDDFPRKGGGRYRALDPKVHAQEVAIRDVIANERS